MTRLRCSARNCMYNEEQLCSKGEIEIGGRGASKPNETCCESFQERRGGMKNSVGRPQKEIEIDCHATNCNFNQDCKCCANEIGIAGSNACDCGGTECASFDCHCK